MQDLSHATSKEHGRKRAGEAKRGSFEEEN
jgi:hypothetical protein